jgi:hypothetical protein
VTRLGEFSPIGNWLLWADCFQSQKQPKFLGYCIQRKKMFFNFDEKLKGHSISLYNFLVFSVPSASPESQGLRSSPRPLQVSILFISILAKKNYGHFQEWLYIWTKCEPKWTDKIF